MTRHVMPPVEGYDLGTQPTVAFLAASLDDQLRRLREDVAGLDVEALEWQEAAGRNTIGMLLAHLAVAEAWWFHAGARGISEREGINEVLQGVIRMNPEDDGIPLAPDGGHPATLAGKTLGDYLALLERARAASHEVLRGWTDADLDQEVEFRDRRVSRGWILYHVLEHMVAHYGQILLLKRIRADRGLG